MSGRDDAVRMKAIVVPSFTTPSSVTISCYDQFGYARTIYLFCNDHLSNATRILIGSNFHVSLS